MVFSGGKNGNIDQKWVDSNVSVDSLTHDRGSYGKETRPSKI